ncbi:hypothetical protein DI270_012825 [Microbispora triticiradicis]|uniref:Uncharacterized protein n=1 Tax=Microbispora triticiradicis TaxID=2200763 RepID=A0ABX9LKS0_9ACTN|nr:hypothetical protein DI270_012825 [Microbispora triticiradicis]
MPRSAGAATPTALTIHCGPFCRARVTSNRQTASRAGFEQEGWISTSRSSISSIGRRGMPCPTCLPSTARLLGAQASIRKARSAMSKGDRSRPAKSDGFVGIGFSTARGISLRRTRL